MKKWNNIGRGFVMLVAPPDDSVPVKGSLPLS